jgi:hypothetical protein
VRVRLRARQPAAQPSTQVVRIKRDFGKPHFDLAIDAWLAGPSRIDKVQLLWVNTSEEDRRKPLGKFIERMVALKYKRISSPLDQGRRRGRRQGVHVHRGARARRRAHTYVAVDTDGGQFIARCRADSAKLLARRVIGIPVGISRVVVSCRDADGNVHAGQIRHKEL